MKTAKIGSRSVVFTFDLTHWDLNLHLILGRHRNYLIDTGLGSGSIDPILAHLAGDEKPVVVINTHHHWDHMWGNHCFGDSLIIAHSQCGPLAAEHWDEMLQQNSGAVRGAVKMLLPNLVFDDQLYFADDNIRLFHTPGHTTDGISVFDEQDRVLNAGDNIGDTMEEILPHLNTAQDVFLGTIQRYKALGAGAVVSGHNRVLGPEVFGMMERAL